MVAMTPNAPTGSMAIAMPSRAIRLNVEVTAVVTFLMQLPRTLIGERGQKLLELACAFALLDGPRRGEECSGQVPPRLGDDSAGELCGLPADPDGQREPQEHEAQRHQDRGRHAEGSAGYDPELVVAIRDGEGGPSEHDKKQCLDQAGGQGRCCEAGKRPASTAHELLEGRPSPTC